MGLHKQKIVTWATWVSQGYNRHKYFLSAACIRIIFIREYIYIYIFVCVCTYIYIYTFCNILYIYICTIYTGMKDLGIAKIQYTEIIILITKIIELLPHARSSRGNIRICNI